MDIRSPLQGTKVTIIGGSIAGCSAAILLKQLGADITILERSKQQHIGRGAGIVLPEPFIKECIEKNLFDQDIPRFPVSSRSFLVKYNTQERKIWSQPSFSVSALNWSDIYQNLCKRIPDENFHYGKNVNSIEIENGCQIETLDDDIYSPDMVIAADGIDSGIRKQLLPQAIPQYVQYVAWRGVINNPDIANRDIFQNHIPYYVYSNGHILLYRIPDNQKSGNTLLNWVMYEDRKEEELYEMLVDKNGVRHSVSLPPGSLSAEQISYLHDFARRVLPQTVAEIICQTEQPFLQAVFDMQVPQYVKDRVCFIGDAATVLRPHSASGVLKALKDSISLGKTLEKANSENLVALLNEWNTAQLETVSKEVALAKSMGEALVTKTPNWEKMNSELVESWWQTVMTGKSWYATPKTLFVQLPERIGSQEPHCGINSQLRK